MKHRGSIRTGFSLLLTIAVFLSLGGCSSTPDTIETLDALEQSIHTTNKSLFEDDGNYAQVKVFFATDRGLENTEVVKEMFGGKRGKFRYGSVNVSIPREHKMGELEEASILNFEFRDDPEKHVVVLNVDILNQDVFFNQLRSRVNASEKKHAFVYIHGYNNSFDYVARRTAQMAYDLAFDGAPIFYSWPSQATVDGYPIDENNVEWTLPHLKRFLTEVATMSDADAIYLVAHSMGNRALTRSFIELMNEQDADILAPFKEIILTAPDIDAEIFKRDIAPKLVQSQAKVTLYSSSKDKALQASKTFHGYPRAGDSGESIVVVAGMDTIDASDVATDFVGHAYFAQSRSIIADLFELLHKQYRAEQRSFLQQVKDRFGAYWKVTGDKQE
ncbi:MAG: alpha/beta hydrolase [Gammaproteobacteria bacterium]|nr:alpha/beta hydrolase [Gammaproteobacteria bacterium]